MHTLLRVSDWISVLLALGAWIVAVGVVGYLALAAALRQRPAGRHRARPAH